MLKMTGACHYHCHLVLITEINAKLVFDGPSGLYNACNATFMRNLYTIRKREESITRHYGTFKIEIKGICLVDRLVQGIYP